MRRREDFRLLTGGGQFTDDLSVAGAATAWIVRSSHAHARISAIDVAPALRLSGVIAVLTATDLAADGMPHMSSGIDLPRPREAAPAWTPRPILASNIVRCVGEPIALVIAEDQRSAHDAAELVGVDYEPLPSVTELEDALAAGAATVWPEVPDNIGFHWQGGDLAAVQAELQKAARVVRRRMDISRVSANPLEPRAAIGSVEQDGRLVLRTSTQNPYQLRDQLAASIFRVEPAKIQVIAADVGGSFGMKAGLYREDILVLWAARRLQRAVRWTCDRAEAFQSDDHGRAISVHAALALDEEARFRALQVRYDVNVGCYLSARSRSSITNIGGIAGVYRTKHISAEVYGVLTHTSPTAAYRGAGRPEATYVIERMIDLAAAELGMDPYELRLRNLIPAEAMPYKTGFLLEYDSGDFAGNMQAAARLADLAGFPARRGLSRAAGRMRGLGISNPIEIAGGPVGRSRPDHAELTFTSAGTVVLSTGAMSTGQGLESTFTQLVAERLGIPPERVCYRQGDTTQLQATGRGSGGSSALAVSGSAVSLAADALVDKARALAAKHFEVSEADLIFAAGRFHVAGTDLTLAIEDIAGLAQPEPGRTGTEAGLTAGAEFRPANVTFPNGCHICEVEIDPETGKVQVLSYVSVEDVGRVFSETLVHGQIHGGVAQGIGQALGEQIVYERDSGQLLTASFLDYQMPLASDLPAFAGELREIRTTVNPMGAKGVGEAGTVGALAATMNAVCDALSAAGIRHLDMPATPARIWTALNAAGCNPGDARHGKR
jgi:carbon-monoxide dehydrogenase large subunit